MEIEIHIFNTHCNVYFNRLTVVQTQMDASFSLPVRSVTFQMENMWYLVRLDLPIAFLSLHVLYCAKMPIFHEYYISIAKGTWAPREGMNKVNITIIYQVMWQKQTGLHIQTIQCELSLSLSRFFSLFLWSACLSVTTDRAEKLREMTNCSLLFTSNVT